MTSLYEQPITSVTNNYKLHYQTFQIKMFHNSRFKNIILLYLNGDLICTHLNQLKWEKSIEGDRKLKFLINNMIYNP